MTTSINKTQELLVWGFVREIEKIYKIRNIPFEINDIIYVYQKICDRWSRKYSSKQIKINQSGSVITVDSDQLYPTAFGGVIVNKDIQGSFKWRLKILSLIYDGDYGMEAPYIGIIIDDEKNLVKYKDDDNWDDCGYQLCAANGILCCNMSFRTEPYWCKWCKDGDILEMTLDLNARTLSYKVNDKDFGVAFSNIKQANYRLALSMDKSKGSKFELL